MSAGDDTKTREELLAEIDSLKAKLERQGSEAGKPLSEKLSAPVFSAPLTRRALASWVAPVILSLPVLGSVLKPGTAHAVFPEDDYIAPTSSPTGKPVAKPTAKPTLSPTAKPVAPAPTAAPSATPTIVGRCIPAPVAAPTLGMGAAPDSSPSSAGFVALGSARAVSGLFDT